MKRFKTIAKAARIKLELLYAVVSLNSLRIPPGNRLESLKGDDRLGKYPRKALDSLLFILAADHRWLKAWHSDGRLKALQAPLLGAARNEGLICWKSGAAGGSFSLRKRRRSGCCAWICKAKAFCSPPC